MDQSESAVSAQPSRGAVLIDHCVDEGKGEVAQALFHTWPQKPLCKETMGKVGFCETRNTSVLIAAPLCQPPGTLLLRHDVEICQELSYAGLR